MLPRLLLWMAVVLVGSELVNNVRKSNTINQMGQINGFVPQIKMNQTVLFSQVCKHIKTTCTVNTSP